MSACSEGSKHRRMRLELDTVAADWQVALEGAADAIEASNGAYSAEERRCLRHALARERVETARLLELLARSTAARQVDRSKITSTVSCSYPENRCSVPAGTKTAWPSRSSTGRPATSSVPLPSSTT